MMMRLQRCQLIHTGRQAVVTCRLRHLFLAGHAALKRSDEAQSGAAHLVLVSVRFGQRGKTWARAPGCMDAAGQQGQLFGAYMHVARVSGHVREGVGWRCERALSHKQLPLCLPRS